MNDREIILSKIRQIASQSYPDSEVILYGSRARGDADENSDWDILILLNQDNIPFEAETKLMDKYYELELQSGQVISPLIYSKFRWNTLYKYSPLKENIKHEGIRIK